MVFKGIGIFEEKKRQFFRVLFYVFSCCFLTLLLGFLESKKLSSILFSKRRLQCRRFQYNSIIFSFQSKNALRN